ncbi:MAG: response regulator transcription factor [Candidatus Marinimicrobia bacterium]|nr:response regulator transcription factor [Candidatus Neomarinimicrobiota bacterium]MCF7828197.1 response regulator transcription factor [Candidatus Neomarinimicrobiota bacterium]MCF7879628.1 response regulator transcription factor [Candidatus Neomarinimicrobiota bacterium]
MIDILVADDHKVVRAGLKKIFEQITDLNIADVATTGQEVIDKVSKENFDVVIMDISIPGQDGLAVTEFLRTNHPDVRVLVLSIYPEDLYAVRAIKAGAFGYLNKKSTAQEIISAVRTIANGQRYVPPAVGKQLAVDVQNGSADKPHKLLSNREFQVLRKIAKGQTVTEIAEDLSLSVKTISTYRSRILRKMEMSNNSQLTRYALENKITI